MKKRIVVEKSRFDAVLSQLLNAKAVPRKAIKTRGKHGPKTPLFSPSKS